MNKQISKSPLKGFGISDTEISDLVVILSDQFRNPLSVILLELDQIIEQTKNNLELYRKIRKSLYQIRKNSLIIAKTFNDLMDHIESDLGQLSPQITQFNVVKTLDDTMISSQKLLLNNHVSFIKNTGNKMLLIQADENFIERCMLIFLSDAAKHSTKRQEISVSLDSDESEIIVSVKYHGEEKRNGKHVFDIYTPNNLKMQGQLELGLALAKKLVESQHGRIWFKNEQARVCSLNFAVPIKSELEQTDFFIRGSLEIRDRVQMELAEIYGEIQACD